LQPLGNGFYFSESKKKQEVKPEGEIETVKKGGRGEGRDGREERGDGGNNYISAINAMRNPDILMTGAAFLKGNMFFKEPVSKDNDKK